MKSDSKSNPDAATGVSLIVSDAVLRAQMERVVNEAAEFTCAGAFASLAEAWPDLPRVRPALAVLEDGAAVAGLVAGIRQLKAQAPGLGLVAVVARPAERLRARLRTAQADAVLDKTCFLPQRFLAVLRQVRNRLASAGAPGEGLRLTPTQAAIAVLIARGWPDKQIADARHCSEETVGWHLKQIFRRNGLHTRAELAARFSEERRPG